MISENKVNRVEDNKDINAENFTIARLFFTWFQIGALSFGGGATTQYLIQEKFIYKHKWITNEEYSNIIGVSQMAPGINIISYTILIGKKLGGWLGILVSLLGLLIPSTVITVALTALYICVSKEKRVHSALHTIFPAIFGISLATSWRNVSPIIKKNYKQGHSVFGITLAIIIGSGVIYILLKPSVIVLYILGGLGGALTYWYISKKKVGVK